MAFKDRKPGAGKFASGDKFKGRSFGSGNSNSNRPPRDFNSDSGSRASGQERPFRGEPGAGRPAREDRTAKFKGEGKKIYNRSERFTRPGNDEAGARAGGERSRSFDDKRSSFKSGDKFTKPAPFKGNRFSEGGDRKPERGGFNRERSDRPARPERGDRPNRNADDRGERPRYNREDRPDRRTETGGYAARGERRPVTDGSRKPYERKSFGDREQRPTRNAEFKPRFNRDAADDNQKPFARERAGGYNRESGAKRSFERPRGGDERKPDRNAKRGDRPGTPIVPVEAPNYDLKRYQARERNNSEKDSDGLIRLNRYIANAGVCSRREADSLIAAGEIKVNGEPIIEMGYLVKPEDTVTYGKKRLNREKMVYVLLNKPKDFITTTEDPEGRKTVMDLVATASKERIFPVGRLDRNTTGLLLFTNDGELAQKLTHPSNNISKIYQVELDKPITREHFEMITNGLELEDGKAEVDDLALVGNTNTFLGIQIHIGKNRIVRRIFEHLGYEVVSLDRVQYANLTKKDVPRGKWRFLSEKEVIRLKYFL